MKNILKLTKIYHVISEEFNYFSFKNNTEYFGQVKAFNYKMEPFSFVYKGESYTKWLIMFLDSEGTHVLSLWSDCKLEIVTSKKDTDLL